MELYRLPPFPLTFTVSVGVNNTLLTYSVKSYDTDREFNNSQVSNSQGEVTITLPDEFAKYDEDYSVDIFNGTSLVYSNSLAIVRPYFDPRELASLPEDIAKWSDNEVIARSVIDSMVGGFYYKQLTFERTGVGSNSLTLGYPVKKLISVKENGVVVYDSASVDNEREFTISDDGIYMYDINEDDVLFGTSYSFTNDSSYMITAEVGWNRVPREIAQAAQLLASDFYNGTNSILDQYISRYETNEFRVHLSSHMFEGTGNRQADRLLSKFYGQNMFKTVGVL